MGDEYRFDDYRTSGSGDDLISAVPLKNDILSPKMKKLIANLYAVLIVVLVIYFVAYDTETFEPSYYSRDDIEKILYTQRHKPLVAGNGSLDVSSCRCKCAGGCSHDSNGDYTIIP